MTNYSAEGWSKTSGAYDDFIAPMIAEQYAPAIIGALGPIATNSEILEVAAGTGALTRHLARLSGRVLATDYSEGMIIKLRERMDEEGIGNVHPSVQDGMNLQAGDDEYDHAVCNFGLMLFPDPVVGMQQLFSKLRPGGTFAITTWASVEKFDTFGLFMGAVAQHVDVSKMPPPRVFALADANDFAQKLRGAGFVDVNVTEVTRTVEFASPDHYWDVMTTSIPPAGELLEMVGPEKAQAIRETCCAMLQAGDQYRCLSNTANLASGAKPID